MLQTILNYVLKGGAKKKAVTPTPFMNNLLFVFVVSILDLLFRGLIVTIGYNIIVPKIIESTSRNPQEILANFRPISFWDSIVIIITLSTLINCKSYTIIKN